MIPYLKSEKFFRLYEPYLAQVVNAWPQVVLLKPVPPVASLETLITRLRLSINALQLNIEETGLQGQEWVVDTFAISKFMQIVDDIYTSLAANPGFVTVGPSAEVRKKSFSLKSGKVEAAAILQPNHKPDAYTQVVPTINLDSPQNDLIQAVLTLHHYRLLNEPSKIKTTFDIPSYVTEHKLDVNVEKEGESYIIL